MQRRAFIARGLAWLGAVLSGPLAAAPARASSPSLRTLLESSPFVYVSPLRSDGSESSCHAEVWYAWLDEAVVVIVAADRWKARAVERGLTRTRIWVGDHGRWKGWISNNEEFRSAPSFEAVGERVRDAALLDRLLAVYEAKYPDGFADGSRVLLRYRPANDV